MSRRKLLCAAAAALAAAALPSPSAAATLPAGTLYLGGGATEPRDGPPQRTAGDLVDVPRSAVRGALELRPDLELGPIGLSADLWLDGIGADGAAPAWVAEAQSAILSYAPTPAWHLAAGWDVFSSGTAYVWNPSNPFGDPRANNLDRAYPYHREGDPFASVDWYGASNSLAVQGVDWQPTDRLYGPEVSPVSSLAVQWSQVFDAADLTLTLAKREDEAFGGIAGSATIGERLELHAEAAIHNRRRTLLPVAQSVPLPGGSATLWRLEADDGHQGIGKAVAGGQYTFGNLTNIILEYFYNGEGYTRGELRRLRRALAASGPDPTSPVLTAAGQGFAADGIGISGRLRRHYLFGRIAVPDLAGALDLNVFLRWGLSDAAHVAGMLAELPLSESLAIRASAEYIGGPAGSEAELIPYDWTASLALTLRF